MITHSISITLRAVYVKFIISNIVYDIRWFSQKRILKFGWNREKREAPLQFA